MAELLFREDPYLRSCEATVIAVRDNAVELDRTIFYPLGGGQLGDTGTLESSRVVDTRKGDSPDSILHMVEPGSEMPKVGQTVVASLGWERRHRLMRYHTALHLLGAVVKAPVSGG
jgi:misacylated tRNA(Ala) deacylase